MNIIVGFFALLLERLFGYPDLLQGFIKHPVQWMGALIGSCDRRWNKDNDTPDNRRAAGILMLVLLCLVTGMLTVALKAALGAFPLGWLVEALLASTLLAHRQLAQMVGNVATALDHSLEAGRLSVAHIVGRDTTNLDAPEISRAAIETLAENASDGVIAPLFWLLLFGLPGIAIYKAINTADSMVGHLNPRYKDFGWASAKLDDLANWIPARLTALLFVLAAKIKPDASAQGAWDTVRADALKHKSSNAGWPEAAMAGALGFGLGGARTYNGQLLDLPQMGSGKRDLGADDIRRAVGLFNLVGTIALAGVALMAIISFGF